MNILIKLFLDLISWILHFFPRRVVRALGLPLGILWFDILRVRRKVVLDNLKLAFPDWSEEERIRVGRKSVYQMLGNLPDYFLIPNINKKWLAENYVLEGEEYLKKALSLGKGIYGLSLHLGNGDVGASGLSAMGYPVNIITKIFKNKTFNQIWFYIRKAQGVKFIEAHGSKTPFEILKAIKANEIVFFVNDQFMGRPYGIETDFFGVKTGTAYGLALFYMKTRSPIIPTYTFEDAQGRIHLKMDAPIELDHLISEDKDKSYYLMTQEINKILENIIRSYPEQWMWVHRRWKTFE